MSLTVPKTILLLIAASTIYTLWIVPYQSGLLTPLLNLSKPGAVLPGPTSAPVRLHYTGIKLLDRQLVTMIAFFWPGIEGSRADISLVLLEILAQVDATWVLLVIESLRVGNKGKWYITSWVSPLFNMTFKRTWNSVFPCSQRHDHRPSHAKPWLRPHCPAVDVPPPRLLADSKSLNRIRFESRIKQPPSARYPPDQHGNLYRYP